MTERKIRNRKKENRMPNFALAVTKTIFRKSSIAFFDFLMVWILVFLSNGVSWAKGFDLPDLGEYEVFSMPGLDRKLAPPKRLLNETSRNAINEDGLCGFFVAETADRLQSKRMFAGCRYYYQELTSRRGVAYRPNDEGAVNTTMLSAVFIGDWAEWSVTIPYHDVSISAPRTTGKPGFDDSGIGDLKLGWKATYLPDRSYYRFAYGVVTYLSTGDPEKVGPANVFNQDEVKLFGCVTTKETDRAVGNFELGAILNSHGLHNRFIYRLGMSYQANRHVNWIGEFVGEVEGGQDRDSMDMIFGMRFAPSPTSVLELAYTENLRTYREYGYDRRLQAGATIRY